MLSSADAGVASALAHDAGLPLLVAELLTARGVRSAAEAERFLHPQINHLLDPFTMLGMRTAVERMQRAIAAREPILIYGDYDVDGTTAIVLLKTAIEMLHGEVRFHVPHRLREGYGMQREILETAAGEGVCLVVSVDTGIRAFAAAEAAEALGLDLIVTDHHLPEATMGLPKALAVLNPNQAGCAYRCRHLCGAGVAFKLSQALLESHIAPDWDPERVRTKILPSFLKMVAIATVADAVPLLGENRTFVASGLEELRRPVSAGLRALMQEAQLDPARRRLTSTDIGFRLGPRINAAGRMDVASDVVELFTTRDQQRAKDLAAKLEKLNRERRETEAAVLDEITQRLADPVFRDTRCIVMDGEDWHRGIIGILASRIVDRTGKPAIVITREEGTAYGSGRSIAGFHLLEAIENCQDLFTRFGGHAHAVGFSLPAERVDELRSRLTAWAAEHLTEEDLGSPLTCHAELPLDRITPALFSWLRRLEPFGIGNEEPVFIARNVRLAAAPRYMKEKHVRLQLAHGPRANTFSALGWNQAEQIRAMELAEGQILHVAYRLRENEHPEYGGIELEIVDLQRNDE
ncbi:single-stranded-DNA-specific exonuclease RecJ [Acidipila sp. 4G-K13]|uniref:Single-stranded-DNA-specific exonuclease RecJ n=2 Tax=Paracidobacterium acidisoli TaxID=2303751 RepID=A0A372IV74_9BACT|nr:single-stranded-DNA-specific exonuclease RecJ [Paracidobacterium acidisoli]MBT9329728.1 single-stranded-DNA-specific exonuclease RecJ [Paracidobacterium acidisoli]